MMRPAGRRASLAAGLVLVASLLPVQGPALAAAPPASSKLRGDLAAVVAGTKTVDPRISALVADAQPGEVPYFVYLSQPNDASHRAALESLGARVLRSYRTLPVFALASSTATVARVAATSWVAWLAPVELVFALDEPVADQTRGTPADVGAPAEWDANITGTGVRIAILDTGVDPSVPELAGRVLPNDDVVGGFQVPDQDGHGTDVASIAAGALDAPLGAALAHGGRAGALFVAAVAPRSAPSLVALRCVGVFAFAQAVHYGAWLRVVPDGERAGERPVGYRRSLALLRADFGRATAVVIILSIALPLAACVALAEVRGAYFTLAAFHGYLELAFVAAALAR